MACQRDHVLESFLNTEKIKELSFLSETDLRSVNFADQSNDLLIEVLKTLIFSYCNGETEQSILKNINNKIKLSI